VLRSSFNVTIAWAAVRNGFCILHYASPAVDQLKSQLEGDDQYRHTASNDFCERLASEIPDGSLQQRRVFAWPRHIPTCESARHAALLPFRSPSIVSRKMRLVLHEPHTSATSATFSTGVGDIVAQHFR